MIKLADNLFVTYMNPYEKFQPEVSGSLQEITTSRSIDNLRGHQPINKSTNPQLQPGTQILDFALYEYVRDN